MSRKIKDEFSNSIKDNSRVRIQLNDEQKDAVREIYENMVSVIIGRAGCGKTLVALYVGYKLLEQRKIKKIILSRPSITVGDKKNPWLPGTMEDKYKPLMQPLYDNLIRITGDSFIIDNLQADHKLEILPIDYMQGHNFTEDEYVIIDEAQNLKGEDIKAMFTRLCTGAKLVLSGDIDQINFKDKKESKFNYILSKFNHIEGFKIVELKVSHRDKIVDEFLKVFEQNPEIDE